MMDLTDRHCRYFLRLLSRRAVLYTEMVTSAAVLKGDRERLLAFDAAEQPLALQVGGSEPAEMARCAVVATDMGYAELNINVGCPSDRVQSGRFGACLMAEPGRVADCVAAMKARTPLPVTVKTRIGVDHCDSYEHLLHFVDTVSNAGCNTFIVHARKAWLSGLSPKENREIPPLRYPVVHRLKRERRDLRLIINGGLTSLEQCQGQLAHVDGVMMGREAYRNPYLLAAVDSVLFGDTHEPPERRWVVEAMTRYAARRRSAGEPVHRVSRHMLGLFQGCPGARAWRRYLSENAHRPEADARVLLEAVAQLPSASVPPRARVA